MRRSSHLVVANVTSYPSSRGVVALFLAGCISLACGSADEGPSSSLTGKLAVYESSFKDGSSTLDYGLRREGLPEVRVELANPPRYAPGTPIKVSGQFDESGSFVASSIERSVDAAPVGTRSEALTAPTQTRSVAILLVRPSNEPEPPPFVVGKELVMNNLFGTESLPDFPAKTATRTRSRAPRWRKRAPMAST